MKGTSCGKRVLPLLVLVIAVAMAPATAFADSVIGGVGSVVASTPTAPAVPSVPTVAAPAAPAVASAPAPATPAQASTKAQVSTPVASATVDTAAPSVAVDTPVASATVSKSGVSVKPKRVAPKKTVKTTARNAKKDQTVTVGGTAHAGVTRSLMWSDMNNDKLGCMSTTLTFTTCDTIPVEMYPMQNMCNSENVLFTQGTITTWAQTTVNPFKGTVTIRLRTFFKGYRGQGDMGNVYTGADSQDDFTKEYPIGTPLVVDHRQWETLVVTKPNYADTPTNMYFLLHTTVSFSSSGAPSFSIQRYLVCQPLQRPSEDCNRGDDGDRDGHHHHESYKGYNDDDNTWDN